MNDTLLRDIKLILFFMNMGIWILVGQVLAEAFAS